MNLNWTNKIKESGNAFLWRQGLKPIIGNFDERSFGEIKVHYQPFSEINCKSSDWVGMDDAGVFSFSKWDTFTDPVSFKIRTLVGGKNFPEKDTWSTFCNKIEDSILEKKIKKFVPVRSIRFRKHSITEEQIISNLFSNPQEGSFRFALKKNNKWFCGSSPELLFEKKNGQLVVPCIAGTKKVTSNLARDKAELLCSEKDLFEHSLVTKGVFQALEDLGLDPKIDFETTTIQSKNLLHLFQTVSAKTEELPSSTILKALHPTPAVGCYPRSKTKDFLLEEPIDRGMFASPILIEDGQNAICIVAIRSFLITREEILFYAGAGFVEGSNADGEWQETLSKIQSTISLLES